MENEILAKPYSLEGRDEAVLLVHGFTGTPAELRSIAELLNSKFGWKAIGIRLSGHGTKPQDLANSKLETWDRELRESYEELTKRFLKIHLIGISMGASLCLRLACRSKILPTSLVLLVPAVFLFSSWREKALDLFRFPLFHKFKPWSKKENIPEGHLAYRVYPTKALPQLKRVLRWTQGIPQFNWPPTFFCQAGEDETIDKRSVPFLQERMRNPKNRMIELKKSGHIVTLSDEKDLLFKELESFYRSL